MKEKKRGVVLILSFMILITMASLVGAYLYATGVVVKSAGFGEVDDKVLWLSEAGFNKAVWNLMTPPGSGGQGENWPPSGTATLTESLGNGSYTIVVAFWDFALAANGATASATSSGGGTSPARAIDGNDATYWQSQSVPTPASPQNLTITLPYTLTLNKVRFLVPAGSSVNRPRRYSWQVSSDNINYTTVFDMTGTNNDNTDVTNSFSVAAYPAAANVNFLRLHVERTGGGSAVVRIATLQAIGRKITSTGTVSPVSRTFTRTVVTDSNGPQNQVAYFERDWNEQ